MGKIVAIPFNQHAELVTSEARRVLTEAGFTILANDTGASLSREAQKAMMQDAFGAIAGVEPYDEDILSASKSLKIIARYGVGFDNIDLAAAKARGVRVSIFTNHNAVAEHAVSLMLALLKNLRASDITVRAGVSTKYLSGELCGRTVGIVGFGRIGRRVAEILSGFGATLLSYDPAMDEEAARVRRVTPVSLDELLERSDIVTLHFPHTVENHHFINSAAFAKMKKGALLINTARGKVMDTDALLQALRQGAVVGAGLDVFEEEPLPGDHPLTKLDNVILTPHVASNTKETNDRGAMICAQSIVNVSLGGEPLYPIL